jgi:hypothetical protein
MKTKDYEQKNLQYTTDLVFKNYCDGNVRIMVVMTFNGVYLISNHF